MIGAYIYIKKYKSIKLFITLLIIVSSHIKTDAQGTPFLNNITPDEYGYESQNYSIIQDDNNIIYIANLNGVIEYDGTFWRLIKINGIPTFAKDSDNKIYVGGYNNFGYLEFNKTNGTHFKSLINKLDKDYRDFGQINDLISIDDKIFFYTDDEIFYYVNDTIGKIEFKKDFYNIFKVRNNIFVCSLEGGLQKYENNNFIDITYSKSFVNKYIEGIVEYNNDLLIKVSDEYGFTICSNGELKKLNTQADNFIRDNIFSKAILLSNNDIAIATKKGGLAIIDNNGKIKTFLSKNTGLQCDEISNMFVDSENNLWLTLNFGISKIKYPSAFNIIDNKNIKGHLTVIADYNNKLYVGTSLGLYVLHNSISYDKEMARFRNKTLEPVTQMNTAINSLLNTEYGLIIGTSDGIYTLENDSFAKISDLSTEIINQSRYNNKILYVAHTKGMATIQYKNNKWIVIGSLSKLDKHVRTIAEEDELIWLGTDYEGVYLIDRKEPFDIDTDVLQIKNGYGLPSDFKWIDVYSTINGTIFSTYRGIYRLDSKSFTFYEDTILGIDFSKKDRWIYPVVEQKDRLWFSIGYINKFQKTTGYTDFNKKTKKYTPQTLPFNKIRNLTIEYIYPEKNNRVWFASFGGLISFDEKNVTTNTDTIGTLFRSITVGRDSSNIQSLLPYNLVSNINDSIPKFKFNNNKIRFEFALPYFTDNNDILYQFYLEGYEDTWADWENINFKEYTNLHEGEYTFKVKGKNIYNKVSTVAEFKFIIKAPIYRTFWAYLIYFLLATTFFYMIYRWRIYLFAQEKYNLERLLTDRTEEIVKQKERIEDLVSNILPKDTVKELQQKGKVTRRKYKRVTVLFSDIKGFTQIAEHTKPEELLDELDTFFLKFDEIVDKHNIEKIKTIGDAYMCAGGIPKKNQTNPIDIILAAIEVQQYMLEFKEKALNNWDIRIGVHTGPVIAGIVGSKKLSYDIWGDTVNIASRMESTGMINKINISDETYVHVNGFFECEHRGKVPIKYKGDLDMYFVTGIKQKYSVDGLGIVPNEEFLRKLQWVRFPDLEDLIMEKLEKGLPKYLKYHNTRHTIDVLVEVEILGIGEDITDNEMLLLKTAALFHDLGFIVDIKDHEEIGSKMAEQILADFKYTKDQIKEISNLILCTKYPPTPKTNLERIICDADLDYLGRKDFIPVSAHLYKELQSQGQLMTTLEWNKLQISFLSSHKYYTETAFKLRNPTKLIQLEKIKQLVTDEEEKINSEN